MISRLRNALNPVWWHWLLQLRAAPRIARKL